MLLTNLTNLTQPLIRYELTDAFIVHPSDDGWLRATATGRVDETFRYGAVDVHPLTIRTVMVNTAAVREYQVQQTPHGIDVSVVVEAELDEARLSSTLADSLQNAGIDQPQVTVRRREAILPNPETGKTKRFIPLD